MEGLYLKRSKVNKEVVPFSVPDISEQDKKDVIEALSSRWLTGGPRVEKFEKQFASYVGVKYAVAVNSCTAALHLTMRALDVGPDDEVIVPTLTFAATANVSLFCGAKPVFADIDEKTFNISPQDVLRRITARTKAIIVVHYGGQPCDMNEIMQIAENHKLAVIEDCAHSLGASYFSRQTGGIGTAGCFSFYPTKNITTLEGGMVTSNDKNLAHRVSIMRSHAMTRGARERSDSLTWYYDVVDLGYNYRLNEVQAALGMSQLSRVDEMNNRRIERAHYYTQRLKKVKGLILPFESENRTHVYHLYVVRVVRKKFGMNRDQLFRELSEKGIGLSVHYTPLHLLSYYKEKLDCKAGDYPIAERISKEILSLPLFPGLIHAQMDFVVKQLEGSAR